MMFCSSFSLSAFFESGSQSFKVAAGCVLFHQMFVKTLVVPCRPSRILFQSVLYGTAQGDVCVDDTVGFGLFSAMLRGSYGRWMPGGLPRLPA